MRKNGFEGWYFKHQNGDDTIAFIVGRAENGAFLQVISSVGAMQIPVRRFHCDNRTVRGQGFSFSQNGCEVDLPEIHGSISYGPFLSLASDIMGPFRFLPMECRHGVISMAHALKGKLTVQGHEVTFDGGVGYIEKDSGISFPGEYQWMQCNSFSQPCAVMASIANIPFVGLHFTGCIAAVICGGKEYRFATYRGVHILAANAKRICLLQGKRRLQIDMAPTNDGFALAAPVQGKMQATIRESHNAAVHVRMWERGKIVLDLSSKNASYEYVPQR